MNASVARVARKFPGFSVDIPDAQLGSIERQLQALAALVEGRLAQAPLSEQCGQYEGAQ